MGKGSGRLPMATMNIQEVFICIMIYFIILHDITKRHDIHENPLYKQKIPDLPCLADTLHMRGDRGCRQAGAYEFVLEWGY